MVNRGNPFQSNNYNKFLVQKKMSWEIQTLKGKPYVLYSLNKYGAKNLIYLFTNIFFHIFIQNLDEG